MSEDTTTNPIVRGLWVGVAVGAAMGTALAVGANLPRYDYLFALPTALFGDAVSWILRSLASAGFPIARPAAVDLVHVGVLTVAGALGGAVLGAVPVAAVRRLVSPIPLAALGSLGLVVLTALVWKHRGIAGGVSALATLAVGLTAWNVLAAWSVDRLLAVLRRRPIGFAVLAVLPLIALVASRIPVPDRVRTDLTPGERTHPLLLIGLDAASWANLGPEMDAGRLPNLAGLRARGVWGELESTQPSFSPVIWTSMVTGRVPRDHGILDFTRNGVPYSSNSRTAWALWEILPIFGRTSAFHYWWASWPAEAVPGRIVTDHFLHEGLANRAYPPEDLPKLEALAAAARRDARPISDALGPGGDALSAAFRERHRVKLGVLESFLLRDELVTRMGEDAVASGDFDLVSVYLRSIDAIGHKFWKWHYHQADPRMASWVYGPPDADQEILAPVVSRIYAFTDEWVGRVLAAAGDDWNVVVVSDHGMTASITLTPSEHDEGETGNHHRSGFLLMAGPDIREGTVIRGASIYDVFPTLLYLLDLPQPEGLPGRALAEAVRPERRAAVRVVETYGPRPEIAREPIPTGDDEEYLEGLRALGYVVDE